MRSASSFFVSSTCMFPSCLTIRQKMSHWMYNSVQAFRTEQNKHQSVSKGDCCGRHFLKQKTSSALSISDGSIGSGAKIILLCGLCVRIYGNTNRAVWTGAARRLSWMKEQTAKTYL